MDPENWTRKKQKNVLYWGNEQTIQRGHQGDLIRLRRDWYSTTRGLTGQHVNVHHLNQTEKIIAFHRWRDGGPGDDVMVIANFAHRAQPGYTVVFPHAGLWRICFNSDDQGYDPEFSHHLCPDVVAARVPTGIAAIDGLPYFGNVTLAPLCANISETKLLKKIE